jgi:hypothetical protein
MRHHFNEKLYKCDYKDCNKRYNTEKYLKNHNLVQREEKNFICDFGNCNKVFKIKYSLNIFLKYSLT